MKYTVTIQCPTSMDALIAAGRYGYVQHPDCYSHYRHSWLEENGTRHVDIYLARFDQYPLYDIEVFISRRGYEPADVVELLSLGAQFPDLQRKESIFTARQFYDGLCPVLETEARDSSIRRLGLISHGAAVSGLFAVVKNYATWDWSDLTEEEINRSFVG